MAGRKQIIVLGGGVGALTAAYHLSSAPNWKQDYDLTVYQLGWRLGGKCASSRNPDHAGRIEEHGLHVWFGFYENAFGMLRTCYSELGRPSPLDPQAGTFEPRSDFRFLEEVNGGWLPWDLQFPDNGGQPGLPGNPQPTAWTLIVGLVEFAVSYIRRWLHTSPGLAQQPAMLGVDMLGQELRSRLHALDPDPNLHTSFERGLFAGALRAFRDIAKHVAGLREPTGPQWRRVRMVADLLLTVVIGIIEGNLLNLGFDSASDEEFLDWLRRFGADGDSTDIAQCVLLRALYDTCFAFEGGDVTQPNFAAGVAMEVALRIGLSYTGAAAYMTRKGMGEVAVAPLHDLLVQRGVQFEFFQRVVSLEANAAGTAIQSIHFSQQATVKPASAPYDPLMRDAETPYWPNRPKYADLVEGAALQAQGIDLESHWYTHNWPDVRQWQLDLGPDDQVVLGISLGALPVLCADLGAKNGAWQQLLTDLPSIQTQSMQLWLRSTASQLGWAGVELPTVVAAPEPHDVWADMSQLLKVEHWPVGNAPASVQYFCGPMTHDYLALSGSDPAAPGMAMAQVRATAQAYLEAYAGWLLPGAALAGSRQIDWNVLYSVSGASGPARLAEQWLRPNIDPTERYVLSPAGRNASRLPSDNSGFANLVLAGDWTRSSINAGCVEAAVMSGMAASRKLCGVPQVIYGEHFLQG